MTGNLNSVNLPVVATFGEGDGIRLKHLFSSLKSLTVVIHHNTDGREWNAEMTEKQGHHRHVCIRKNLVNLKEDEKYKNKLAHNL